MSEDYASITASSSPHYLFYKSSLSGLDKGSKIFSTAVRAFTVKANNYLHHSLGSNDYPTAPDAVETLQGSGKDPIKGSFLGRNNPEKSISADEPEEEPESDAEFKFKSIKKSKAEAEDPKKAPAGKGKSKGKAADSGDDDDAKEDDDDKIEEPGAKKSTSVEEMKKPSGKSVKVFDNT